MARRTLAAAAVTLAALTSAPSAFAHAGNPNYESLVRGVTPSIPGFTVQVLNGDDRLEVENHGKSVVTIDGYSHDPFVRMSPDGTVEVNLRSPAYYLDQDRDIEGTVPPSANAKAAPQWKVIDRSGRYEFHDHRMHWMSTSMPKHVTDQSKRTKVFDWQVPIHTASVSGAIKGQLFWRGSAGGPPTIAFVVLALLALGSLVAVVVMRRRRAGTGQDGGDDGYDGAAGGGGDAGVARPAATPRRAREEVW
jgi:hypothetical protein